MKIIYYKSLIKDDLGLTPAERIVYCFIVSQSLLQFDGIFEKDGAELNPDMLDFIEEEEGGWVELPTNFYDSNDYLCCGRRIAKHTGVPLSAVQYSIKHLRARGLLNVKEAKVYMGDLWKGGFFELLVGKQKKLRGELLIFHSWLYENTKIVNHVLAASIDRIADNYGKTHGAIRDLIHRLTLLGLTERREDGKLLVK